MLVNPAKISVFKKPVASLPVKNVEQHINQIENMGCSQEAEQKLVAQFKEAYKLHKGDHGQFLAKFKSLHNILHTAYTARFDVAQICINLKWIDPKSYLPTPEFKKKLQEMNSQNVSTPTSVQQFSKK